MISAGSRVGIGCTSHAEIKAAGEAHDQPRESGQQHRQHRARVHRVDGGTTRTHGQQIPQQCKVHKSPSRSS